MTKNKELFTEAKASEASDRELDKVSGGTDIISSENFQINNNNFDTSIKFNNFDMNLNISNNINDMNIKQINSLNNILINDNFDIKKFNRNG